MGTAREAANKIRKKRQLTDNTSISAKQVAEKIKLYNSLPTESVNESYINTFLSDSQDFLNSAEKSYSSLGWSNASSTYENISNTWKDLNTRHNTIRGWLYKNKNSINKETYDSVSKSLDSFNNNAQSIISGFEKALNAYSQFETEDAYNEWKKFYDWSKSILEAEDFLEKSQYVSTYRGGEEFNAWAGMYTDTGYEDIMYDYINRDKRAIDRQALSDLQSNAAILGLDNSERKEMSDDEIKIFNYLYATQGSDVAYDYIKKLTSDLNYRQRAAEMALWEKFADESPVGASIFSVLSSPLKGLSYLGQLADYTADGKIDENEGYNKYSYINSAIRNEVAEDMNGVGSFIYQTGMSIGDFLFTTAVSGGNSAVSLSIMGSGAAADTVIASKDMGLSDDQAFWLGTAAGAVEVATEKIGIDALFDIKALRGSTGKYILKNIFAEGTEEGLSNIGNTVAELVDLALNDDESKIKREIYAIMQEQNVDESTAIGKYVTGKFKELGLDVLGGAISGGVMAGTVGAIQNVKANKTASKIYGDSTADLVAESLELDPNNKYAQKMQNRLDSGKSLSGGQINRLIDTNETTMLNQDISAIQNAVKERLAALGETGNIETVAKALAKQAQGEKLTSSEKQAIKNSKYGQRVANELNTDNIRSGQYSSTWAEQIGTNRINAEEYSQGLADAEVVTDTKPKIISENGKTKIGDTEISIKEVASVKDGEVILRLEDDSTVNAKDVEFGSNAEGLFIENVVDMNLNAATANAFIRGYNPSEGLTAQEYILGFREAYKYGEYAFPIQEMSQDGFSAKLSQSQKELAYGLGKTDAKYKTEAKQKAITEKSSATVSKKEKVRKGKVYYEGGALAKSMTARQKASLKGLETLAEALNIDFHIFESKVDANGKRKGANGWFNPKDGSIYIDLYAGQNSESTMLFTAAHELTHFIREWSPAKFKVFADFLLAQYGQKGISVEELVNRQIEKAKRNGRDIDYDTAYEEVIADSCETMLADGDAIAKIAELKAKDKTLWQKIKDFITDLVAKIKAVYEGLSPDTVEGRYVSEMLDSAEKLKALWTEALVDASDSYIAAEKTLAENGIAVDSETDSASLLSVRDVLSDDQRQKVSTALAERFGVTQEEAMAWLKAETSMASLILNPKYSQYLDYTADPKEVAIKQNSDYPQGTVDFSPICAKRREFTSVMNNILRLFPNHVFAATDLAKIRSIMQEEGMTIPCGICYVEDRRQLDTIVAQNFIDSLKLYREGSKTRPDGKAFNTNQLKGLKLTDGDSYTPSVYELVSLEGLNVLKEKNPNMAEAWVKFNNARGMQSVRLLANEAEYKRQILKYDKRTVKSKNDKGGLRVYSFSDAEMFHLIDIIQVITDSATVGLSLQGYTKVNEYAKAVKDTGEKLNRSLIPKGELGYHIEDGKVVLDYDTVEGIDINHPDFFDNKDNPNVGNITIGVSDVQIRAAMVSNFVDQIIPFHTGQSEEVLGEKGIATWSNYKDFQTEKDIATDKVSDHQINIYTEVLQVLENEGKPITKKTFVEKFLQVCKENNLIPRFSQFLNTNEKGEFIYTEGYHKMLVDFKTFAQTEVGEYLPQKPVKPIFDDGYITRVMKEYVKSQKVKDADIAKSMPKVIERITNEIIKPNDAKLSDRDSEGNTLSKEQQEFFKDSKVRDADDNLIPVYHGTFENFTIFDINKTSNANIYGKGHYFTSDKNDALNNYASGEGADVKTKIESLAYFYFEEMGFTEEDLYDGEYIPEWNEAYDKAYEFYESGKVFEVYLNITNPVYADKFSSLYDKKGNMITEVSVEALKAQGYDGIIDYHVSEKFSFQRLKEDTAHYIVFDSSQIKLTTNKTPTSDPDIRYSDRYQAAEENPDILSMTARVESGDFKANDKVYLGTVSNNIAKQIHKLTGVNVEGFKVAIEARQIEHILKDHGKNGASDKSMANPSDIAKMEYAIKNYDDIRSAGKTQAYTHMVNGKNKTADTVLYEKAIGEKAYYVVQAVPDTKAKTLYIVTAFIGKKGYKKEVSQLINANSLDVTAKTGSATTSNSSIPQNTENVNKKFSDRDSYAPTFYSQMGKVIDDIKMDKIGANSVVNYLKGKGIKNDEIKWSGIEAFLEGKKSITKSELQAFVAGSQLVIEEEMSEKEIELRYDGSKRAYNLFDSDGNVIDTFTYNEFMDGYIAESDEEIYSNESELREAVRDVYGYASAPKWADYKLDGGENYRELVFKMPNSSYSNRAMRTHWGQDAEGILVHARIQDFVVNGKKMLFIEELQSDWHNEGMEKGYSTEEYEDAVAVYNKLADDYTKKRQAFNKYVRSSEFRSDPDEVSKKKFDWLRSKMDTAEKRMHDAERDIDALKKKGMGDVPDAPFRDTYHEYVLKRLLRMAAEEGYDSIGWTPADIQSQRWSYDYEKAYKIEYDQEMPKFLRKYGKRWGATVSKTAMPSYEPRRTYYDVNRQEEYRSFIEWQNVVEQDLKAQGAPMRNLKYESDDNYWIAFDKVSGAEYDRAEIRKTDGLVWSMDITESMKNSVLSEGQALYSDRDPDSISNRSLLANALESVAQNDTEKNKLAQYKAKIELIESEQAKLSELRAKIKELSFAKGVKDTKIIKSLQFEANQTANRINTYDKQLLNLESTKALKNVLEREKEMARKRERQKGKEALTAYREKATQTQRELMTRYQESRKKGIESRHKTEMRHKIHKIVSELNQTLLNPTKEKHVPIGLQKPVAEALAIINMDTVGAEERIAKYDALIAKAKDPDKIEALKKSRDNIELQGESLKDRLEALKNAYAAFVKSEDPLIRNAHNEAIENLIENTAEKVGNTSLRNMSYEQLEAVYDMFKAIRATVRNANKMFKEGRQETVSENSSNVSEEIRKIGGHRNRELKALKAFKKYGWNMFKPITAMKVIGSKTFENLFNNVRAGEDTWAVDVSEAKEFFRDKAKQYNYWSWDFKKQYSFKDGTNRDFSLSLEQIMSLYAYSKRNQADRHLEVGGFVFDDAIEVTEKKHGIPLKYTVNDANPYRLNKEGIAEVISALTEEQKQFLDEMQAYLSDVMGAKGNEVSLAMYDIKLYNEKNYFPLKTAKHFREFNAEQSATPNLKNSGFSKKTVPQAGNPIVLSNFMDVWSSHINDMSMYHAFVLPLEDFMRVYNYSSTAGGYDSVQQYIKNAYGSQANTYIETLLKDLNGGARVDTSADLVNKGISLFKKASVFASASVVIQQPSAMARAMAYIHPKYFATNPHIINHKAEWAELKKYAPIAIIKEMGYFDTNVGKKTTDWITERKYEGVAQKSKAVFTDSGYRDELLSKAPAMADELSWTYIWEAVKKETKSTTKLEGEELLKQAGKRFTEVIANTQVYDSVLSRSAMMRSKDTGMKMATAFMAEPTTVVNMMIDGIIQKKRGNKKFLASTVGAVSASIILNSILVSLVYAARDDDEDETYPEKYLGSLTTELIDGFNPITYLPFAKDIWSIAQGYDVERSDMSVWSKLVESVESLFSETKSGWEKTEEVVGAISSLFGLPFKNILRDARGIYNLYSTRSNDLETTSQGISDAIEDSAKSSIPFWKRIEKSMGVDESKSDKLYEAIMSGDQTHINRVKAQYATEQALTSAIRSALRENDTRIHEAAQARYNGDITTYKQIAKEIIAEGRFSQDDVVAAINAEINTIKKGETSAENQSDDTEEEATSIYKASDINSAFENGDNTLALEIINDLINTKIANGMEEKNARSSIRSSMTSYWKPLYKEAYQNGDANEMQRIRYILFNSGLYGNGNEVVKTVQNWLKD